MKKLLSIALFVGIVLFPKFSIGQGLKSFELKNGLTVYVWEDPLQTDVFGMVSVKAGSANDPEQFTGLAHYLEHLMFKGTNRIGALNWEEEKIVYDQIIEKYDQRAATNDVNKKRQIDKEINELTVKQAALSASNEFSALVEKMGGLNTNAGTIFDYTVYFNSFPVEQLERWLDLYSVRFMNPVFRLFQTELETVYEEYNVYEDNQNEQVQQFLLSHAFNGHPYSRPIIGLGEHLKNPQISKLIEFYQTWYTPQNMALILVGNIKTEEVANLINRKFARLPVAPDPVSQVYPIETYKGRKQINGKVGQMPQTILAFNGVPTNHPDYIALNIAIDMLSNSNKTGLLDKLSLDGDVMYAGAYPLSFREHGRMILLAVPAYDYNQRNFESHRTVEKLMLDQINKLAKGEVNEWLFESVKSSLIRSHLRTLESAEGKANIISSAFVNGQGAEYILDYSKLIEAVTYDDINRVVKKYLNNDFVALHIDEGKNQRPNKIEKPTYTEVPEPLKGEKSHYQKWFEQIELGKSEYTKLSFDDVSIKPINEKSKLFYYPNKENNIFTMTIKYGIGTLEMPKLEYAVPLMNNAGILAAYEPQEFKSALSQLNARINYSVDDNYMYVRVEGYEDELSQVCNLLTRQMLMPKLESKQLNNLLGESLQSRRIEKENLQAQRAALFEYMMYNSKSSYIDRLSESDIMDLTINELTGLFQTATSYAAEVHYVGQLPFDKVHELLSVALPLKKEEIESNSPNDKTFEKYSKNKVIFLPNNDLIQSTVLFFTEGSNFSPELIAGLSAFNQYFGGGFDGLVMNEIREKNSMAYSATGTFNNQSLKNSPIFYFGNLATQADKTIDAISLYMNLVNNMPQNSFRIDNIKEYVRLASLSRHIHFRTISQEFEMEKRLGFSEPSAYSVVNDIEKIQFDDVVRFYEENLKGKPMVIGVIGNPRQIDLKKLEMFGEVERINTNRIFK